jgi:hypothetical protein
MKFIKSYKLFESNYSIEEYISEIVSFISKYDISPTDLNKIIQSKIDEIEMYLNTGKHPIEFAKNLVKELDLEKTGGYLGYSSPKVGQYPLKYL